MKRALDNKKVTPIHAGGDLKTTQDKGDVAKSPPAQPIKSLQFDLFGAFVTNNRSEVSNTIAIWERIPNIFQHVLWINYAQRTAIQTPTSGSMLIKTLNTWLLYNPR